MITERQARFHSPVPLFYARRLTTHFISDANPVQQLYPRVLNRLDDVANFSFIRKDCKRTLTQYCPSDPANFATRFICVGDAAVGIFLCRSTSATVICQRDQVASEPPVLIKPSGGALKSCNSFSIRTKYTSDENARQDLWSAATIRLGGLFLRRAIKSPGR